MMNAQETLGRPERWGRRIGDYVALMKPRIIILLLITTIVSMWMASPGPVAPELVLWTFLGGTLSAGAANALNMYLDRDVDAMMYRTRGRPLPAERLDPGRAMVFGVITGILSVLILGLKVNWLASLLSLSGLLFYVFIYTAWLKRSTPQNIVIGGAAGAVPPLVGWAAVTGEVGLPAVILFLIIFLWTPPHFWALALLKTDEYRQARIPMLPVTHGEAETKKQIMIYTLIMVICTLVLYPMKVLGLTYLVAAAALGAIFLALAVHLARTGTKQAASWVFSYSIIYLAVLFGVMVVDLQFLR